MAKGKALTKQPTGFILLTAIAVAGLVIYRFLVLPYPIEQIPGSGTPLGKLLEGIFSEVPAAGKVLSILLFLFNALLVTRIVDKFNIAGTRTFLPAVIYISAAYGLFMPANSVCAALASLLLIISSYNAISSFKRTYTFRNVFISAFCLGVMPLLYSPAIIFVVMLPVTLWIYQRTAREWIIALTGLCLPLLFCSTIWWMAGDEFRLIPVSLFASLPDYWPDNFPGIVEEYFYPVGYIFLGVQAIILIYSAITIFQYFIKTGVRIKKIYFHFTLLSLLCAALYFMPKDNLLSILFFALPFTIISTSCFCRRRNRIPTLLYILLLFVVIFMNLSPLMV